MVDRPLEERRLTLTEYHIAKCEVRLARQRKLIKCLKAQGQDTTEAERLLDNIVDFLNTARVHRLLILERPGER
jgi:hypothetical protein